MSSSQTRKRTGAVASLVTPDKPAESTAVASREVLELWYATRRRPWRTLALVPTRKVTAALALGQALGTVGKLLHGAPLRIISAHGMAPEQLLDLHQSLLQDWEHSAARVIVLDPLTVTPLGINVALAADAALICLEAGRSSLAEARRSIELIGREKIVGCVLVDGETVK